MPTPTAPPPQRRNNMGAIDDVRRNGKRGEWYAVAEYDNLATARDAAFNLRMRNPDMEVVPDKGIVKARRPAPADKKGRQA